MTASSPSRDTALASAMLRMNGSESSTTDTSDENLYGTAYGKRRLRQREA